MQFKFSRCICLQTPQQAKALSFYADVLGLDVVRAAEGSAELAAKPVRMFIDEGEPLGPILEFFVPDLEKARQYLMELGCVAVKWEGVGGRCYLKDPFGFIFNLYQAPEFFEDPQPAPAAPQG